MKHCSPWRFSQPLCEVGAILPASQKMRNESMGTCQEGAGQRSEQGLVGSQGAVRVPRQECGHQEGAGQRSEQRLVGSQGAVRVLRQECGRQEGAGWRWDQGLVGSQGTVQVPRQECGHQDVSVHPARPAPPRAAFPRTVGTRAQTEEVTAPRSYRGAEGGHSGLPVSQTWARNPFGIWPPYAPTKRGAMNTVWAPGLIPIWTLCLIVLEMPGGSSFSSEAYPDKWLHKSFWGGIGQIIITYICSGVTGPFLRGPWSLLQSLGSETLLRSGNWAKDHDLY